ncbi:phosphonoacetate hydrolase [Franzmannia pantelleriensis]|uniref:Phosphonoacetate hydrolase n=1 Tax=Franzmannia pantelleriensis TaxID=48727 RepID=A0A1G9V8S3_9GAMM|nr:zinc ribbon domain-containing protein YjdM [Halomonas pantelleriensis]SDM68602.1 phosphonoacetate hydrolase [Halomonas pantelleriensis]
MSALPNCPACGSEFTYHDGIQYLCPECGHEWTPDDEAAEGVEDVLEARDANGNLLADGDSVTVIKDLKVKGSSSVIKVGTKVKSIRLIEGDAEGGHNLDCKVEGIGPLKLTSAFVKKV